MLTFWRAIVIGLFALSMCAYLAATYLMVECEDRPDLLADFRRRAIASALASGALALLALVISSFEAPRLLQALFGRGFPLFALALLNGPLALWAVWRSRPRIARVAVAGQVVLVLWAWAPGAHRTTPPLSHEEFVKALQAWLAAGMPCPRTG